MANSRITIHPKFQIGEISPRLFSAFLEPIGSMVNGFMYNPNSFEAEWGQRESNPAASLKDGIAATKVKVLS